MSDLAFSSLVSLARRLRQREVSSLELLDHYIERVERLNPQINAVISFDFERARERAKQADAALSRGEVWGPLHGIPMTLKDTYEVAGLRTTAGAPIWSDHVPTTDADVASRVKAAGAVVFAKTNVPFMAADLQTYNEIFGTTNNPWNFAHTPGGSSGGAAAAVAAGLTSCEVGSDIGGSIRIPAHYCGVFGHKPSWGVVSPRGHMPGPPGMLTQTDINVCGPIGRSPGDLPLMMDVLSGPPAEQSVGWQCRLPGPRCADLRDYRVAAWIGEQGRPLDDQVRGLMEGAVTALGEGGVDVDREARPAVSFDDGVALYWKLVAPILSAGMPSEVLEMFRSLAADASAPDDRPVNFYAKAAIQSHHEWMVSNELRERMCKAWAEFFERFDVLLCPVTPVPAIPHMQDGQVLTRTIDVNGSEEPYMELLAWMGFIGVARLPSTVVPLGLSKEGLPIGVQVVGPYLEDYTTMDFAGRLAQLVEGVGRPPAFV